MKIDQTQLEKTNHTAFEKVGAILTSLGSLVNHSCDNNVEKTFYNGQIIMFANNYIKKGDQVKFIKSKIILKINLIICFYN